LINRVKNFVTETETVWDAVARVATQKLSDSHKNVNNLTREISIHTRTAVDRAGERLTGRVERLLRRAPQIVLDAVTRTDNLEARIRLLDPKNVLARGWSITRTADGQVIRSTADVSVDEKITTVVADGSISSTVN
jgi:exodeoxyribonuclease VII large subunit